MIDRSSIRKHIVEGETKTALSALDQATKGTKWHNKIGMLQARYERMRDKELMHTEEADDLLMEQNKINHALLEILDQVGQSTSPVDHSSKASEAKMPIWKWALPLIALALIAFFVFQWMGAAPSPASNVSEPETTNQVETPSEKSSSPTTPSASTSSAQLPRYEKWYVGKTDGNRYTPTEIRYLELLQDETRVTFNFKNDNTRPITIKQVFLSQLEAEQAICKDTPNNSLSEATLNTGEQKDEIVAGFPCVLPYAEELMMQVLYELKGSGEEKVYKISFKPYEIMKE